MSKLVFEIPNAQTPGYLRRAKKGLEFKARLATKATADPEAMDDMVDFLVDYVTEPEDRAEAKETLWDATEEDFNNMLDAITGGGDQEENPTADGKPSTKLEPSKTD